MNKAVDSFVDNFDATTITYYATFLTFSFQHFQQPIYINIKKFFRREEKKKIPYINIR